VKDYSRAIELWKDWNSRINVISRKDTGFIYEHHILHSLAIAHYHQFLPGETVLDLGCGGGFPGIPLAMEFPLTSFTLCDSVGKKITVASSVAEGLSLENVECVNCRVENLPQTFDYVVSRAVASLDELYPWVKGKFRKSIICLKGGDVDSEIGALCRKCHLQPSKIYVWQISQWLDDEYFKEKFVIEIGK